MGNRYLVKFANFTPSATAVPTLISAANRRIRVLAASVGGGGATSAAQALVMSRSATGTTPAGAITPTPAEHSEQPAAVFTTASSWAAAPAGATNGEVLPFNALGGGFRYTSTQKLPPIEARNGEVISFIAPAGVTPQNTNLSVLVEED
jgi:hypothetical protein